MKTAPETGTGSVAGHWMRIMLLRSLHTAEIGAILAAFAASRATLVTVAEIRGCPTGFWLLIDTLREESP